MPGLVLLVFVTTVATAGLLAGGGRAARMLAVILGLVQMGIPWLFPTDLVPLRGVGALGSVVMFMRILQMALDEKPLPARLRLLQSFSLFDLRRAEHVGPGMDRALVGKIVGYGAATALGAWFLVDGARVLDGWSYTIARWAAGAFTLYCGTDLGEACMRAGFRIAGLRLRSAQDVPIAAASVGEFWGKRWNREVHAWVHTFLHTPLAQRDLRLAGMIAAFSWTGFMHAYPVVVGLGWGAAGGMMVFFLLQVLFITVERALGIKGWPRPAAHAWAVVTLLLSSPLFVEPGLTVFGMPPHHPVP